MLKMKLSDLTFEVMRKIVKIYDETVGANGSAYLNEHMFTCGIENIRRHSIEWRFGSRVTGHSKLWIHSIHPPDRGEPLLVYFRFGPNIDKRAGEDEELANRLKKEFEKAIDDFLTREGLAVEWRP